MSRASRFAVKMAKRFFLGTEAFTELDLCEFADYISNTCEPIEDFLDLGELDKALSLKSATAIRVYQTVLPTATEPPLFSFVMLLSGTELFSKAAVVEATFASRSDHAKRLNCVVVVDHFWTMKNPTNKGMFTTACIRMCPSHERAVPTPWGVFCTANPSSKVMLVTRVPTDDQCMVFKDDLYGVPMLFPHGSVTTQYLVCRIDAETQELTNIVEGKMWFEETSGERRVEIARYVPPQTSTVLGIGSTSRTHISFPYVKA